MVLEQVDHEPLRGGLPRKVHAAQQEASPTEDDLAWTWGAVTSAAALFDAGAQAREDFANDWDPATTI